MWKKLATFGKNVEKFTWILTVSTAFIAVVTWAVNTYHDWEAQQSATAAIIAKARSDAYTIQFAKQASRIADMLCKDLLGITQGAMTASSAADAESKQQKNIAAIKQISQDVETAFHEVTRGDPDPEQFQLVYRAKAISYALSVLSGSRFYNVGGSLSDLANEIDEDDKVEKMQTNIPDDLVRSIIVQSLITSFEAEEPTISEKCLSQIPLPVDIFEESEARAAQVLAKRWNDPNNEEYQFGRALLMYLDDPANSDADKLRGIAQFNNLLMNMDRIDPARSVHKAAERIFKPV
jgi:hypothetical protein